MKDPYQVKNAEMRLPQYLNALTFQSWRRAICTAAISCPNGASCAYSHKKEVIDKAKKAREEWQAIKGKGKGKGKDKGKGKGKNKDKDKDKDKGKGKGKICPYFNDKGCNNGSARKMLHEAPAMAARDDQTQPNPAPKAKAAAAPKAAAAADPSKP